MKLWGGRFQKDTDLLVNELNASISFDQRASWAVRKDCPQLAAAANKWHEENMTSPAYTASMKRYFEIGKAIPHSPILSLREGKISHYDDLFKKYAPKIDWDWRLLASLAYTESNFDSTAVSWAGARGLMQLMPVTARAMGLPEGKEQNPSTLCWHLIIPVSAMCWMPWHWPKNTAKTNMSGVIM